MEMPTWEIIVRSISGVILTVMNAFFVTTEFALTRLRQFDKNELGDHSGLSRAWEMTEKLEIYLTGCQLGISATSILLGVIFEPAVTVLIKPAMALFGASPSTTQTISVVVSIVIINLVHKIWGEQAPTYLGIEKPVKVAQYGAPILYWWTKIMYPIIFAGDGIAKWTLGLFGVEMSRSWVEKAEGDDTESSDTKKDSEPKSGLKESMISLLKKKGDLPKDRQEEVIASLEIGEIPVKEIMREKSEIAALDVSKNLEENLKLLQNDPHSRYPLMDGNIENYIGNIYVPAMLWRISEIRDNNLNWKEIATDPMRVDCTKKVSELIDLFQEKNQEIAMVEEDGNIVGMVTLTDAMEAIVGQARDPIDVELGRE